MKTQLPFLVFANTVVFDNVISGGDIVFPQVLKSWKKRGIDKNFQIKAMTTTLGKKIWLNFGPETDFHLLPKTTDKFNSIGLVPFVYFLRLFYIFKELKNFAPKRNERAVLYTSSDFLPDIIPAFILRKRYPKSIWVSRIYHAIPPPTKRKGNLFYNIFSYLGQRLSFKIIKRNADLVAVLGGTYVDLIRAGFPKKNIIINNAGIPLEILDSIKSDSIKYDVVTIGGLNSNKGAGDLVDIWKRVVEKKKDAKLAIIGGSTKTIVEQLRNKIKEENLEKNIDYLGFVPKNEDVYKIIKSSKIYLCPGHENGWSMPVAEAMGCGVPTVAYKLKMFNTAFKRGFATVPLYDVDGLANAIVNLTSSEERRDELAKEAFDEGRTLSWDEIAGQLFNEIEKTLKNKKLI